jgi:hypothetical protein
MSDYRDPMYRDPNFPNDPLRGDRPSYPMTEGGTPWGWIIGAFFIAAIVVYAFTVPSDGVRTASTPEAPTNSRLVPTPSAPPAAQPFNPAPPPNAGTPPAAPKQ